MFVSPFGFESLESWKNPNYTISALYTYGQPNWHMGFRTSWEVNDSLTLMALVVNGINNISETQQGAGLSQRPNLGGAATFKASDALTFSLGGLCALDQTRNDDEGYDVFGDFVSTLKLGAFLAALNVDYIFTHAARHFVGASLTTGFKLSDAFRIAARAEYLHDQASFDGQDIFHLFTGTLTFDIRPVPERDYLIVRWENRVERSNQRIFGKSSRGTEDTADDRYRRSWFESVIGVVVTTNP
jgi:hypothetical protein